jgi:hypothetical protein
MEKEILELHKQMDLAFIAEFCDQGTYLDGDGKTIHGVCRAVSANEVLEFMHRWNAVIAEVSKGNKNAKA